MDNLETENQHNESGNLEPELSFSDKLTGIFSEPGNTYSNIASFPLKHTDWLIPVIITLIIAAVMNFLVMSNPEIAYQLEQKQIAQQEKMFDDFVKKGAMTQAEADKAKEESIEKIKQFGGGVGKIFSVISIIVFGFVAFFISCGIYFLIAKFILKGEGSYISALIANGLTYFIVAIQSIIAGIYALFTEKFVTDLSIATFLDMEKTGAGYFLGKIDPFSIWAIIILGIGLSKMFKSEDTNKYIIAMFVWWVVWSLITFGVTSALPFLNLG